MFIIFTLQLSGMIKVNIREILQSTGQASVLFYLFIYYLFIYFLNWGYWGYMYCSCGNHNSIVSHIQGIIRCRVVVRCIDMDVSFYKKKVHMSEKHIKLKVLTKIIIYPESLNALVSICTFNIPIGGVFSTKKEL